MLAALISGASYAALDSSAAASSCSATVTISGPTSGHLVLSPAAAKLVVGDCLAFTNSTTATVNIAISKAGEHVFSATVGKGATTPVARSYAPTNAGRGTIFAASHVLLLKVTGSSTVTVSPAPSHSPTASASASGHHSGQPTKSPSHSPKPHKSATPTATPHATGYKLPPLPPLPTAGISALPRGSSPVVAPGLASVAPVTSESSTPVAAVVGGPLETVENNSRGLPIAVAVLVVLGLASGYGRVLLATPRPTVSQAPPKPARQRKSRADKRRKSAEGKPSKAPVDKRPKGDHRV